MYRIVTGVTSDVGVPSIYLVSSHNGFNYLSMLGLKLNHVNKRGPRRFDGYAGNRTIYKCVCQLLETQPAIGPPHKSVISVFWQSIHQNGLKIVTISPTDRYGWRWFWYQGSFLNKLIRSCHWKILYVVRKSLLECGLTTLHGVKYIDHLWSRQWLVAYSAPSHYLIQCWHIFNWIHSNTIYPFFLRSDIFVQEMYLKLPLAKCRPFHPGTNVWIPPGIS